MVLATPVAMEVTVTLPVNALRAKYIELSALFTDEIHDTDTIVLSYNSELGGVAIDSNSNNLNAFDAYGGREPTSYLPGGAASTGNNIYDRPVTESITGRVYWEPKKYYQDGTAIGKVDTAKLITVIENQNKLINAQFVTLNGKICKMTKPPIPYGLFGKQYCISYWDTI